MRFAIPATSARALLFAAVLAGAMWAPVASAQTSDAAAYVDAVRLLEQSTFGANDALIAHVMQVGTEAFLNEQFAAPKNSYPDLKYVPAGQQATFCPTDPNPNCTRDYYTLFLLQNAFFVNALNGADQLRQRVAFALSQIMVTSSLTVNLAYGMGKY